MPVSKAEACALIEGSGGSIPSPSAIFGVIVKGRSCYISFGTGKGTKITSSDNEIRIDLWFVTICFLSLDIEGVLSGLLTELKDNDEKKQLVKEKLTEVSQKEAEIVRLRNQCEEFEERAIELEESITKLQGFIDGIDLEKIKSLEGERSSFEEQVVGLSKEKIDLEYKLELLNDDMVDLQYEIDEDMDNVSKNIKKIDGGLEELSVEIESFFSST